MAIDDELLGRIDDEDIRQSLRDYDGEVSSWREAAEAKNAALTDEINNHLTTINKLKAENYDLLMAVEKDPEAGSAGDAGDVDDQLDDEFSEDDVTFDDLFTEIEV